MTTVYRMSIAALGAVALLAISGCSGMSQRQDTATGAVGGAVAGAVLEGGPVGIIGGAVVGGVIGHEVGKDKDRPQ